MSRARNIKPGFFKNDRLAECDPLARLLFAGLWCEADRSGRMLDRPKRLKAEYLPYDDCDIEILLNQLHSYGFIVRYVVADVAYISVPAFNKHQNPHIKEPESTIPAPCENSSSTVQVTDENSSSPADSPSLIPDSPSHGADAPAPAVLEAKLRGEIIKALRAKGVEKLNPANPAFCEAVAAGVTLAEFADTADEFPGKPLPYLCAAIKGRRQQAINPNSYPEKPKAPPPNNSGTSPVITGDEAEKRKDEALEGWRRQMKEYGIAP